MAEKYYWIKLRNTFLTSRAVDFLMSQPNGANYVVLYQCLCLNTINTNGELSTTIGEIIVPYDIAKIQRDSKWFSEDTVRVALALYEKLGLVYTQENGILKINDFDRMVGSETKWADYKRIERDKEKTLIGQCPTNVQQENRVLYPRVLEEKKEEKKKGYGAEAPVSDDLFNQFWKEYPKKVGKGLVETWFKKNKPSEEVVKDMINAIQKQKYYPQWTKDNGQFIPNPSTWLNQKRWQDGAEEIDRTKSSEISDEEIADAMAEFERVKAKARKG